MSVSFVTFMLSSSILGDILQVLQNILGAFLKQYQNIISAYLVISSELKILRLGIAAPTLRN